jgi:uncharacterized protein
MAFTSAQGADKLKVLIVDGQNNHEWKTCTPIMKWILEDCGRFTVDVSTTPPQAGRRGMAAGTNAAPAANPWDAWRPKFSDYDVVLLNYNGDDWPEEVRTNFVNYVSGGGGLVVVHAADNSFARWKEFNEMCAVGGWNGRNGRSGPMIRWRDGKVVLDTTGNVAGAHGAQHEYKVETRDPEHPIMKGLPEAWRHATDELYSQMRGPATNFTLLATSKAEPGKGGTTENEAILLTISYGKGRVFHTLLGHGALAMSGIGFQVTLQRGTEWAATGKVTLPLPKAEDLPLDKAKLRPMPKN